MTRRKLVLQLLKYRQYRLALAFLTLPTGWTLSTTFRKGK